MHCQSVKPDLDVLISSTSRFLRNRLINNLLRYVVWEFT